MNFFNNFFCRNGKLLYILFLTGATCYYESSLMSDDKYPLLPWIGGSSPTMTPYNCFLGCLKIDMVKKATALTIGVSGQICFCGHAFNADGKLFIPNNLCCIQYLSSFDL